MKGLLNFGFGRGRPVMQAVALLSIVYVCAWIWLLQPQYTIVSTENASGIVTQVIPSGIANTAHYLVKLESGKIIRINGAPSFFNKGDQVPLVVMTLSNGKSVYRVDKDAIYDQ